MAICGCSPDQYSVEREYWKIKKQSESILRNPAATPPNELERAVTQLQSFAQKNSKNVLAVDAEFAVARLYAVKDEFEKARKQLKGLMAKYNKSDVISSEALFLIGNTYQIQGKWESALQEYKKIIADYPLTTRGLETPIYIAQYYKVKFQPDKMVEALGEAIGHYRALAEKYPGSPLAFKAYTMISSCYSATKDWENTVSALNIITEQFKGKVSLEAVFLDMIAIYKKELKDNAKAQETLDRLIKEYPNSKFISSAKALLKK